MSQSRQDRDIKLALTSIKHVLDSIQNTGVPEQSTQINLQNRGSLQAMLRKMRINKLSQVFVQKVSRSNLFQPPTYHHIQSEKQRNDSRIFQIKALSLNPHIISLIYILDIIFCLVTFVTGSFRAFIDTFKTSGDAGSNVFLGLMITAIVLTSLKLLINCITKRIHNGILIEYLFDVWLASFKNTSVYIDSAYVGINIALIILDNDSSGLSVALFIISLIKIFFLSQNLRTFEINFINSPIKQQYFNLLKVAMFNIFFAHFVASMLLAMSLIDKQQNWKVYKEIDQQDWFIQYIWAFYWACTIIMTVGFGDFSAFYFRQAIIVAFIQLFSCIVLAYNISQIGSIIMSIRASQTQFRRKIAIFKRMAKQNQIQEQLQRRIQGYLREQTQIKQKFEFNQQNQILAEIPQNLRHEYIVEANKILFPDLPFFKNLQKSTLIKFTEKFSGKVYYPGEYLMKLQEGNDSIMILKSGKVGFAYKKYGSFLNGTIVQQVQVVEQQVVSHEGDFERKFVPILLNTDFLSQTKKINYDIIAQNYSFVYEITFDDFFDVIKTSQIDSSYFFSIRHKHSVVQNQWQQLVCQYCSQIGEKGKKENQKHQIIHHHHIYKDPKNHPEISKTKYHTKFECPKLHYFPMSGVAILKNIRYHGNDQPGDKQYYRKRPRQFTSLMLRKTFFQPYELARNFGIKKKLHEHKKLKKTFSFQIMEKNLQNIEPKPQRDEQKIQQLQAIERIVRQSIEQALTGYKPQFWQLQIDKLYNYVNYFPFDNSKNLDYIILGRGKHHQHFISAGHISGVDNNKKSLLNIIKQLDERHTENLRDNKTEDDHRS